MLLATSAPESRLSEKDKQLAVLVAENKHLREQNETLTEEVRHHKWEHILTKRSLTKTKKRLAKSLKEIVELQEALKIAKLPQNSSNSSRPPSSDLYKPRRNRNYSLRAKTNRKPGGQPGHEGRTLCFAADPPDEEIFHSVDRCTACGADLTNIPGEKDRTHQIVDIAVPQRVLINHITITKRCSCGHCNRAAFPSGAKGPVNYGSNLSALVANLSVRQYMPYKRTAEFIADIFNIAMSEGSITNLLDRFTNSARKTYEDIRQDILLEPIVGADETGAKVNGKRNWFHTYQTPDHTFIGFHPSRGIKARVHFYPDGLPHAILVSDCLAMQLSTPAAAHQLCLVHLLRELNALEEAHPGRKWPVQFKRLLLSALQLKDYPYYDSKVKKVEKHLGKLLKTNQANAPGKIPAFWRRMNTHHNKILTFLRYTDVPAQNNASERAIRNVKVKQKVSGQFKTAKGAYQYAVIRSIIDTFIKQNKNVNTELSKIAKL